MNDLYADEEKMAVSEKGNLLKGDGEMVLNINNEQADNGFTLTEKEEPEEEEEDVAEELRAEEPIIEKEIADDILHKHDLPIEPVKETPKKKDIAALPSDLQLEIKTAEEETPEEDKKEKGYSDLPPYEPTLDLRDYKYPGVDLLESYSNEKIVQHPAELEANKNQIINTLKNYDSTIQKISATIGPTVTLYEIVPAAGVRISRIKNLEDDIALSLAALGIRIIAPIPGRGTIGIEVPNLM